MAMVYTLVSSAKDWLTERFAQDDELENTEETEMEKIDVWLFPAFYMLSNFRMCIPSLFPSIF